jgi:hypothetical protein
MNESTSWIQSNWYQMGILLSQFAFLAVGVWFARKFLQTIRAFQKQFGALLKLSVSGLLNERHASSALAERTFASASPYWLTPSEIPPVTVTEECQDSNPSRWAVAWHSIILWLKTPMNTGSVAPWRKVLRWLQAPARI